MFDRVPAAVSRLAQQLYSDCSLTARGRGRVKFARVLIVALAAIAVAANLIHYNLLFAVTLRPLPYGSPDQLVLIWNQHKDATILERGIATASDIAQWQAESTGFADIGTAELWIDNPSSEVDLFTDQAPRRLHGGFASPNLFQVLDVQPELGRTFTETDRDRSVVLISYRLWQAQFGGRADIVGQSVLLAAGHKRNPQTYAIIGVLPVDVQFTYPIATDIWLIQSMHLPASALLYWPVGRLRYGVSVEQAQREMTSIAARAAAEGRTGRMHDALTVRLEPMTHYVTGEFRPLLRLLWAVIIASAAIAVANIACLLASTIAARQVEFETRYALARWVLFESFGKGGTMIKSRSWLQLILAVAVVASSSQVFEARGAVPPLCCNIGADCPGYDLCCNTDDCHIPDMWDDYSYSCYAIYPGCPSATH